ncbi:MAG: flavodoxin-dependent (E)-4-hydroxy-3-methylbut-2-enyl-diphosphate synthase [Ilumatobacteraceae bacterium]
MGDTIRYSLTADPVEEAKAGRMLLEALGLRERKNADLIAAPAAGGRRIDVIEVAEAAMKAFGDRKLPLQVAVMGCVVNGSPVERPIWASQATSAANSSSWRANVAVVPESEMVDALVEWAEFIHEHGADAAIARSRHRSGRA